MFFSHDSTLQKNMHLQIQEKKVHTCIAHLYYIEHTFIVFRYFNISLKSFKKICSWKTNENLTDIWTETDVVKFYVKFWYMFI